MRFMMYLGVIVRTEMIALTVLCVAASAVLGTAAKVRPLVPMLDGKIVGGQNVSIDDYPYQLSLQYYNQHFCGAALLSSLYAVTAAHCANNGLPVASLRVRAGSSIRGVGGVNVTVSNVTIHPQFNSGTLDYDIAILTLGSAIPYGDGQQPVGLPQLNQSVATGAMAVVSGWGVLNQSASTLPTQLQAVQVPVVSQTSCKSTYSGLTPRMLCAGYQQGGKDACQGDSGGPLVLNGNLIGIVSWGNGCAKPNYPGVYSNVAVLRSFISSVVGF